MEHRDNYAAAAAQARALFAGYDHTAIAKKLGAGHTIARVRNTDYRRDEEMLKKEIGLDMVINPDLAAAQEIADKYGVRTEGDISSLEKRLKLLPNYISSIKDEISEEQLKLKRVSDLIAAYEKIVEGNYIDNLIRAQREQELTKTGEKRT